MERRKFTREYKVEAVRLIKDRGVSYVQASQDLGVHTSQLRDWVKKFADDPEHAFPGHGQMKPELSSGLFDPRFDRPPLTLLRRELPMLEQKETGRVTHFH
jgi:transposase-like protein